LKNKLSIICCIALFYYSALSQNSLLLFNEGGKIDIEIIAATEQIFSDRGKNPSFHKAKLIFTNQWGARTVIPVEVKTRGIFRKNPENCSIPPLLLKFDTQKTNFSPFEGINRLKLVAPCYNSDTYRNVLLKEYLCYLLYNAITDSSYSVRLIELKLRDKYTGDYQTIPAFFIEPDEVLAKRLGGIKIERRNIHPNACSRIAYNRMAIFQYMIGHTDWSIKALHNIALLELEPSAPPVPIPYDFDFSGFVDAPYALPAEHMPIKSVKERHFNGFCRTTEEYNKAFQYFINQRDTILSTIQTFTYLPEQETKKLVKYINAFYNDVTKPNRRLSKIILKCRTE